MRHVTAIAVVAGLVAAVAACARPGDDPAGTPTAPQSLHAEVSAAPAAVLPPLRRGSPPALPPSGCGGERVAIPEPARPPRSGPARPARSGSVRPAQPPRSPSAETDPDLRDMQERARRALEAMREPTPQRAPVPPRALPAAEACVDALRPELNLLAAGGALTEERLRTHLTAQGLEAVGVRRPLTFAGTVDEACIYGAVTPTGPVFELGPLGADGTCRP